MCMNPMFAADLIKKIIIKKRLVKARLFSNVICLFLDSKFIHCMVDGILPVKGFFGRMGRTFNF